MVHFGNLFLVNYSEQANMWGDSIGNSVRCSDQKMTLQSVLTEHFEHFSEHPQNVFLIITLLCHVLHEYSEKFDR